MGIRDRRGWNAADVERHRAAQRQRAAARDLRRARTSCQLDERAGPAARARASRFPSSTVADAEERVTRMTLMTTLRARGRGRRAAGARRAVLPARAARRRRGRRRRPATASRRSTPSSEHDARSGVPRRPDARPDRLRGGAPAARARRRRRQLVFVTAFDQHAIEAFEVNAVDYLLKPVEAGRLEQALERARRRLGAERQAGEAAAHERPARADRRS